MLPFSPIEEPFQDFSNFPDYDNVFGELPSGIGAPIADFHNLPYLPSPISGPDDIPTMSSPSHALEEYPDIRNNVPIRTQHFPSLVAQNPLVHRLTEREGPQNLQVDEPTNDGHSAEPSLAGMELEHPESPLPNLLIFSEILETHASKEEKEFERVANRQEINAGAKKLQRAAKEESTNRQSSPSSNHAEANIRPEHLGGAFTSATPDAAAVPSSDTHGCTLNQDILDVSLGNISPLSRFRYIRPSNAADERPTKRQRTSEKVAAFNSTPAVSQLFSGPSSQVEQVFIQGRVTNSSANLFASMPVVDDAAIQRNLMGNDVGYQCTSSAGASATEKTATEVESDIAIHQGSENVESDFDAGPMPVSSASPSLQQNPKPVETFAAEASLPEQPEVIAHSNPIDYPSPSKGPLHSGNIASVSNAPNLAEDLGLLPQQVHGNTANEDDLRNEGEQAMQAPEEDLNDLGHPIIGSHGIFNIIRLNNPPECTVCGKVYIKEEDLAKHEGSAHGKIEEKAYECAECNTRFKNSTNLRRHENCAHQNREFFCSICPAGFSKQRAVAIHEKDEHGVIPASVRKRRSANQPSSSTDVEKVLIYFDCQFCEYVTYVKGNLKRHIKGKHLNERPYPCPHCDKRMKTKQNLEFHIPVCARRLQAASKKARR